MTWRRISLAFCPPASCDFLTISQWICLGRRNSLTDKILRSYTTIS